MRITEQKIVRKYHWQGTGKEPMNLITKKLRNLWSDTQGGEVIEYALIAGLIVVAAIVIIKSVGTKVLARWQTINSSI